MHTTGVRHAVTPHCGVRCASASGSALLMPHSAAGASMRSKVALCLVQMHRQPEQWLTGRAAAELLCTGTSSASSGAAAG